MPTLLTDKLVRNVLASRTQKRVVLSDQGEPGLRLTVGARGGVWSFLTTSRKGGVRKEIFVTLGVADDMTLRDGPPRGEADQERDPPGPRPGRRAHPSRGPGHDPRPRGGELAPAWTGQASNQRHRQSPSAPLRRWAWPQSPPPPSPVATACVFSNSTGTIRLWPVATGRSEGSWTASSIANSSRPIRPVSCPPGRSRRRRRAGPATLPQAPCRRSGRPPVRCCPGCAI